MEPISGHELHFIAAALRDHSLALLRRNRQRLLAKNVDPLSRRLDGVSLMKVIRQRYVNGIDVRLAQSLLKFVVGVEVLDTVGFAKTSQFGGIFGKKGAYLGIASSVGKSGENRLLGNVAQPDNRVANALPGWLATLSPLPLYKPMPG